MKSLSNPRTLASLALVAVLFVGSALFRVHEFTSSRRYDPESEQSVFWSESAFHYRYARMVAEGESIPEVDLRAQVPEGIEVFAHLTVFMEIVAGGLYRWLSGAGIVHAPFHVFLVHFLCWFSSLSIVAVWLAAKAVWRGEAAALAAALCYAICPLSFNRLIGNYGREDFTLPLLFFFTASFFRAIRCEGPRALLMANLAGLFALLALGSWHLSRFFLLAFATAVPILVLTGTPRKALRQAVWVLTAWALLASFLFPVLVEKRFALSAAMLTLYSASLVLYLAERRDWSPRVAAGGIAGGALGLFGAGKLSGIYSEYSHVYSVLVQKIRWLGQKPADPTLLPFEARAFWSGPFVSPDLAYLVSQAGIFLVWGLVALVVGTVLTLRRTLTGAAPAVFYLLLVLGALFALIQRASSFLVFFVALGLPVLFLRPGRSRQLVVVAFALSLGWQTWIDVAGTSGPTMRLAAKLQENEKDGGVPLFGSSKHLLEWIRVSTRTDDVFMTSYPLGASVLTYAHRPIVFHSMWESAVIRSKYERFLGGLYGSEHDLARLCEEWGVDYFVSQTRFTIDDSHLAERYLAGLTDLPAESVAFRMHFYPDELRRFTPVYQDTYFRVFAFHTEGRPPVLDHRLPFEEVWDSVKPSRSAPYLSQGDALRARSLLDTRLGLQNEARTQFLAGDRPGALRSLDRLLGLSPDSRDALLLRATIHQAAGDLEAALDDVRAALRTRPESAELWFAKAQILRAMGRHVRAAKAYAATLERDHDHREAREVLEAYRETLGESAWAGPPDS